MKKLYTKTKKIHISFLFLSLMVCGLAVFSLTANAQYGTLPLNGNVSGNLTPAGKIDSFMVTTNADGQINLTLTATNSLNTTVNLYDHDGVTSLLNGTTAGTSTFSVDGLATGTYYVKVYSYYSNQTPTYTLADNLVVASVPNDVEPNDTKAQADVLALNGSTTGHINYYYNHHRDTLDMYKVTTNTDGLLRLRLTSNNGSNVSAYLFDNNGTTVLNNITTAGTADLSTDGLAAGTYYVQINSYYNTQFEPYTLADSLFPAPVANDAEPDSSRATALTLAQNSSTTGHIDYYYNNHRDTLDFYKITTNADGLLRLRLTSKNGNNVSAYLFDNNGTTVLNNVTTASTADLSTDGLAAGTYYVQINSYYNTQFEPYTLADSLFPAPVANDKEPDSSRATALTLAQNSSTTGHIAYYYNNHRDTLDFYKITTNADGLLRLRLTSKNGNNVSAYLFDNNGTTMLNNVTTASTADLSTDGLAAGTYYVQINSYYNGQFEPYTLADSLFTYNLKDPEPNANPYQAATIPANRTVTGHIDFYYNLQRDSTDWWKINYTGNGNMNLYYNLPPNIGSGGINNVTFQIYKDTAAAPISNITTASSSNTVNLTGLTQGYYWVRIVSYYNGQFETYAISDSFTQVNVAAISLLKSASHNACGTDSLIYSLTGSHSPYTVRLYRNGALYDSLTTASDSAVFTGLNDGNYYATVFGDGATDAAFGKSVETQFLPPTPAGLTTTKISLTSAQLNWTAIGCVKNYQIQYMIMGGNTWTTINTNLNTTYNLMGLTMDTTYSWRVASIDTVNSIALTSVYSDTVQFTTLLDTARIAFVSVTPVNDCSNTSKLQYQITHSKPPYSVQLYRFGVAYGTPVIVNDKNPFTISNLPAGIYYATAFGNKDAGALGSSISSTILPPIPTGLSATNVMDHSATLNWSMLSCTTYDTLEYRASDSATWKILITKDNSGAYDLANLAGNVTYVFRVASVVVVNGQKLSSGFSSTFTFTTLIDLPVTLVKFSATANNGVATLNWSTATELNDKGFEVFRSADGTNFTSIGFVAGAGNSNLLLNYQFTDKPGLSGNVFYRLKQEDLDGNFVWSNIVHVTMNGNQTITFMPNPAKSFITIASPVNVKEVRLMTISGQTLKVWQNVSPNAQLDLGSIASGTYLVQFLNDQSSQTMKLVKSN